MEKLSDLALYMIMEGLQLQICDGGFNHATALGREAGKQRHIAWEFLEAEATRRGTDYFELESKFSEYWEDENFAYD